MRTEPAPNTSDSLSSESGTVVLVAAALAAVTTVVMWAVAQMGLVLIDQTRAVTAADAMALAAVVWQGADLTELARENGVEIVAVELIAPTDPMVDLEVLSASVSVRYRTSVATARAMARELPLSTLVP
jgi:hypothetical protein